MKLNGFNSCFPVQKSFYIRQLADYCKSKSTLKNLKMLYVCLLYSKCTELNTFYFMQNIYFTKQIGL